MATSASSRQRGRAPGHRLVRRNVSAVIVGKPQIAPGMCFICELSNPVRYIDTFKDFEGIVREKLDGRKYVCEECVEEFAKAFGFLTPKQGAAYDEDLHAAQAQVRELQAKIENFKDLKKALDFFAKPNATPSPARKAPAKPATS